MPCRDRLGKLQLLTSVDDGLTCDCPTLQHPTILFRHWTHHRFHSTANVSCCDTGWISKRLVHLWAWKNRCTTEIALLQSVCIFVHALVISTEDPITFLKCRVTGSIYILSGQGSSTCLLRCHMQKMNTSSRPHMLIGLSARSNVDVARITIWRVWSLEQDLNHPEKMRPLVSIWAIY